MRLLLVDEVASNEFMTDDDSLLMTADDSLLITADDSLLMTAGLLSTS